MPMQRAKRVMNGSPNGVLGGIVALCMLMGQVPGWIGWVWGRDGAAPHARDGVNAPLPVFGACGDAAGSPPPSQRRGSPRSARFAPRLLMVNPWRGFVLLPPGV